MFPVISIFLPNTFLFTSDKYIYITQSNLPPWLKYASGMVHYLTFPVWLLSPLGRYPAPPYGQGTSSAMQLLEVTVTVMCLRFTFLDAYLPAYMPFFPPVRSSVHLLLFPTTHLFHLLTLYFPDYFMCTLCIIYNFSLFVGSSIISEVFYFTFLRLCSGRIPFHAPKAAGPFVYRLFDQSSKEKMLVTLGTSPLFAVRIFDFEVTSNLRFCFEAFEDKCHMKGVTQLQSIITGMCNSGKATRKDDPRALLQSCVKSVLEMALQGVAMLDGAKEQDAERKERHDSAKASSLLPPAIATAVADISAEGEESKKLFKTKNEEILLRQTSRLQMEIYETIVSLRQNDIAWNNLNGSRMSVICLLKIPYCELCLTVTLSLSQIFVSTSYFN